MEPDAPAESFGFDVRQEQTPVSLSSKYPESNDILSENPAISVRKLAAKLGVSNDTAHRIKKEYQETHQAPEPAVAPVKLPTLPNINLGGRLLSKSEVAEMQETFTAALESDFQALDQYLWHRQMVVGIDTQEQPIWSDLDSEEVEKLTKIMLKWGQRNATAATVVRGVVDSSDYVAVASVFIPRVKSTVDIMRKTRRPRARRGRMQDEN
jgi:hypothetical protein